ncbi:MAG: 2-amino-4-hydroxy-6-hydroxymethyldihydropteridine diphosphokinase [Candidatus Promineifilaceae bacterium]|nr:2-amino-4-hydroxy-6-hydroxymethyldihydropteridine diphosphokinase [Candidatus Promineifilaceae bacterium]
MRRIYLGIGTNVGRRTENIKRAIDLLAAQVDISAVSPIYETAAWGIEDQPDFLNLCIAGSCELDPWDLLYYVKNLEMEMGREETIRWGPRLIDIDILLMDEVVMSEPGLTIPHKGLPERATVLVPLNDIAPYERHPVTGATVAEMLAKVDVSSVWRFEEASDN